MVILVRVKEEKKTGERCLENEKKRREGSLNTQRLDDTLPNQPTYPTLHYTQHKAKAQYSLDDSGLALSLSLTLTLAALPAAVAAHRSRLLPCLLASLLAGPACLLPECCFALLRTGDITVQTHTHTHARTKGELELELELETRLETRDSRKTQTRLTVRNSLTATSTLNTHSQHTLNTR